MGEFTLCDFVDKTKPTEILLAEDEQKSIFDGQDIAGINLSNSRNSTNCDEILEEEIGSVVEELANIFQQKLENITEVIEDADCKKLETQLSDELLIGQEHTAVTDNNISTTKNMKEKQNYVTVVLTDQNNKAVEKFRHCLTNVERVEKVFEIRNTDLQSDETPIPVKNVTVDNVAALIENMYHPANDTGAAMQNINCQCSSLKINENEDKHQEVELITSKPSKYICENLDSLKTRTVKTDLQWTSGETVQKLKFTAKQPRIKKRLASINKRETRSKLSKTVETMIDEETFVKQMMTLVINNAIKYKNYDTMVQEMMRKNLTTPNTHNINNQSSSPKINKIDNDQEIKLIIAKSTKDICQNIDPPTTKMLETNSQWTRDKTNTNIKNNFLNRLIKIEGKLFNNGNQNSIVSEGLVNSKSSEVFVCENV